MNPQFCSILPTLSSEERAGAPVSLARAPGNREAVFAAVSAAMSRANWKNYIPAGTPVSVKPNLGWDKLIPGAISAPWVVEGVIREIKSHVGPIYLVEADQVVVDVEAALRVSRLDEVCREHNVTWVNMSHGAFVRMRGGDRLVLSDVQIHEILTKTALITVPLMKTHNKTTITGAIKNQWGCLQALRHNFHLSLSEALVDVNTLVQPRFAVMDATVGLEGDGPKSGQPKEMGLVLASANLVGLDATAARIMGFDPRQIRHLTLCAEHGLGSTDPERVVGESVEDFKTQFRPATHNAVSWVELSLRKSMVRSLAFETPLLRLLSWGARRYYDIWDLRVGSKLRKEFFRRSPFAKQWL
jgi:uncharacterized protein (DUF362 family)